MNNFDVYIQDKNNVSRHILLLLLSAFLITFGVWAYFSPLDITSEALGVVVPSKNIQKIQHLEGGIIESVDVREGDIVSKGQALLSLEGTASISDLEQLRVRMASLRADLVRLEGELNDTDQLKFEKDLEEDHLVIIESAKEMFKANKRHINNLVSAQKQSLEQRKEEIRQIQARIKKNQENLILLREQISISDDLLRSNLTNKMLHLNFLKEESELDGQLNEDEAALKRVEAAAIEAEIRISTIKDNYVSETRQEFGEKISFLQELRQREEKLKDNLKRTVLRAPVKGIVKTIHHSTIAGVVKPGDVVIELVPEGDHLVVEAQFPIHEIVYIKTGQLAKIRLYNPDSFSFGQIQGKVINISPDSITREDGIPFY
ncbi:MAG TPA: HlyD family type I secretion periplasmic adaptor subunit, partial [Alphaproteobacteria bacterium]|nr:HlyD family type I secretion periplasmic adaptor subunit [Alphaproteobacteria bacterium]